MKLAEYNKMGIDISSLSLVRLKGIDIDTPEEEKKVSEVIRQKLEGLPAAAKVQINDIIHQMNLEKQMTPEIEAKYQEMIDERTAKAKNTALAGVGGLSQEVNEEKTVSATPRFCDLCDSKGVRHKKVCSKYVSTRPKHS